jgi:hypothetical protein
MNKILQIFRAAGLNPSGLQLIANPSSILEFGWQKCCFEMGD